MTIAIGILATDGVVLAADRQVTAATGAKLNYGKLSLVEKVTPPPGIAAASMIISGAGSVTSIEHLRHGLVKYFKSSTSPLSVEEIHNQLKTQVLDFHEKHVTPHGKDESLDVSMIVGAMDNNDKKLWVTDRSVVNESSPFASVGSGEMTASSLLGQLFAPMDTIGAILLAAFVIWEVKQSVEGCGNETDIFSICRNHVYWVDWNATKRLEDVFTRYSTITANRLHELLFNRIGWAGATKRETESNARSLRREVERIIESFEKVPEWAKGKQ